jgi:threonylcarbamoyladenosine tRNA methylthiotransferase MtaB
MKKVALHTLGCKLNFAETATLARQFQGSGYAVVELSEPADVVVLNTCSVTERADRECRQLIRRARRTSPQAAIVVTGCYAQLRPNEISAIPGVDLVLGTKEKGALLEHLAALRRNGTPKVTVTAVEAFGAETLLASSTGFADRTRAFLKIQDGCDYQCSFCTIPKARGDSRSVPPDVVLSEARRIAGEGYREVVLTGVNVGDYGRKIGTDLRGMLIALATERLFDRIRVSSIEPNLLDDALLDFWLSEPSMCKHFHIPLQSGSDSVLRSMRRRYKQAHYRDLVEHIVRECPQAGIGADVLVGYPGESEKEFEDTSLFLADLPISYLHVFPYSERPGTDAAMLESSVPVATRSNRAERLRMLSERKRRLFHQSQIGRVLPVLIESASEARMRSGLTESYVRVECESEWAEPNDLVEVLITSADAKHCRGTIVSGGRQESDRDLEPTIEEERRR